MAKGYKPTGPFVKNAKCKKAQEVKSFELLALSVLSHSKSEAHSS